MSRLSSGPSPSGPAPSFRAVVGYRAAGAPWGRRRGGRRRGAAARAPRRRRRGTRSEEHTSELQSHGTISYAVFCLKKKKQKTKNISNIYKNINYILVIFHSNNFSFLFFFFNDTATTEIYTVPYTLSLHDALPISSAPPAGNFDANMTFAQALTEAAKA